MPAARKLSLTLSLALMAALSMPGGAQAADVLVSQAWIRPAVKGQSGTGGFMRLISTQGATLVGFESPVAKAELHEMAMDGDVMRMRPIQALTLPAGRPVDLKPGSYHLMLIGLKKPLNAGESVPLTLKLKTADGKAIQQKVSVPVQARAPQAAADATGAASMPEMGHMGSMGQMEHHGHKDHSPAKPGMGNLDRMPKELKAQ